MVSYLIRELLVLQLGTNLNLSCRSKNFSNHSTELGTGFTCSKAFSTEQNSFITEKSRRFSSWVTSSIAESLKVSSFVRKFNTCVSLSNICQLKILSGMEGLKINSTEKKSEVRFSEGINFDATFASKSASWFWLLGT